MYFLYFFEGEYVIKSSVLYHCLVMRHLVQAIQRDPRGESKVPTLKKERKKIQQTAN